MITQYHFTKFHKVCRRSGHGSPDYYRADIVFLLEQAATVATQIILAIAQAIPNFRCLLASFTRWLAAGSTSCPCWSTRRRTTCVGGPPRFGWPGTSSLPYYLASPLTFGT